MLIPKKDLRRAFTLLTVVTNCFIISGVIHHWRPRSKEPPLKDVWNNTYRYTNDNTYMEEHSITKH